MRLPPLRVFIRGLPCALILILIFAVTTAHAQDSALVFNELNYHPANEATQTEWVELHSLQGVDVDISGWRIEGGIDYTFPSGTIVSGGSYIVVAASPGQITGAFGPFSGQLSNSGETLRLVNLNGRVMDELTYSDTGDWPTGADGGGVTLARRSASAASGAAAWTASPEARGSPGEKNFPEPGDSPTVTTFVTMTDLWKYRDNTTAPPLGWSGSAFDDSAWPSGTALLYAGSPSVSGAGEGLYGYWPLDETSGRTAANLVSGGTAAALNGGTAFVADATRGRVLSCPGTSGSYANAGLLPLMTLTNDFTWSFWAYSLENTGNVVLGNRYSPSGADWNPREFIKFTPQSFQFDHNNVENIDYADMPTGQWVHHAVVKHGATLTYYRNGVNGGSITTSGGENNAQPFYFGGDKTLESWQGRLDDIAVWTKALPESSIAALAAGSVTPLTAPTTNGNGSLVTQLALGPTTHYFRKSFVFSGHKARTTLALQYLLDDGAVFYLNGIEVLRVNMPSGPVSYATAASTNISSSLLSSSTTIPSSALVNGTNILAVEVHQHPTDSDMVFGASLVATETPAPPAAESLVLSEISAVSDPAFFVELQNRSAAAIDTTGWTLKTSTGGTISFPSQSIAAGGFASFTASALGLTPADGTKLFLFKPDGDTFGDSRAITTIAGGLTVDDRWGTPTSATPGSANAVSVETSVVINEIMYHAPSGSLEQWIELYNRGSSAVNLAGWKISDAVNYTFPAGTSIPAGGYLVVAWDPSVFSTLHPGVTALGPFSGSLSGKGERITLLDSGGNVANQVTYSDGGRWSQWADGGGSSLELRDPRADNSKGEAWEATDESAHASWQTVSYSGVATTANGDPVLYNEFVFGLLDTGEFLIDDISVKDMSASGVELIQNGAFATDASTWRIIGTHSGTVVDDSGSKVLKVSALSGTEHMHNHAETTLKDGASYPAINPAHTYKISFRAKWLRGSNRLHTRLWFNRLARQTLLPMPATGGTPGAPNSRMVANIGPTFDALAATPVVPAASQAATVTIKAADPDGVANVRLFTSVNGAAFTNTAMATSGNAGVYSGTVPGQPAGTLVQFYVQATDSLGTVSYYPATGPGSRAMIPWADGRAQLTLPTGVKPHNIRIVLPTADATEMYKLENLMSDAARPCTVILDEREAYYRAGVRLKSSEHGRIETARCGFTVEFPPDDLFLGVHDTVSIDRSGGVVVGQLEILLKRLMNLAGGIYAPEDDIIRVISPVGATPPGYFTGSELTSPAILSKTRLDKEYLDAQFTDGGSGPMFKYELAYVLSQTMDPATRTVDSTIVPEHPKIPQSSGLFPTGVSVSNLGTDKELYRWHWLVQNAHADDDYTGLLPVVDAIGRAGGSSAFNTLTSQYLNVNEWLRAAVAPPLFGVVDNYLGDGAGHNALIYFPPGQKAVLIPWDMDYTSQSDATASLTTGADLGKFLQNPVYKRLFYGHMLDILDRSFNTAVMTRWADHYTKFSADNISASLSYLNARAAYARNVITGAGGQTAPIPPVDFGRTSSASVTTSNPFATVTGNGWINVFQIRLQGSTIPLEVTWLDDHTWSVQVPVTAHTTTQTLVAYDSAGSQLGTTNVTVTGTGGIFSAGPGDLAVTELNYNPPGSGDATEFIEMLNATGVTLDLSGAKFDVGFDYTFPSGVRVAPGARIIVAKNRTAFLAMYPGASDQLAPGQYDPDSLNNSGETVTLHSAGGAEIFSFSYTPAIQSTNGNGRSLVRVLSSTAPNVGAYQWRESIADGGNPGTTDAVNFTGTTLADLDGDGLGAFLEYAFGTSDSAPNGTPWSFRQDALGHWLLTLPRAVNADDALLSIEAATSMDGSWAPASATLVSSSSAGTVATETWQITPPANAAKFFVRIRASTR